MDARWLKILIERGRIHPEIKALERRLRARRGRARYQRPQDLARLPRNPVERAARQDLSLVIELTQRPEAWSKLVVITKKQIEARLERKRMVIEAYHEALKVVVGPYGFY